MSDVYIDAIKKILLKDKFLQEQYHSSDAGKSWVLRHSPGTTRIAKAVGVSAGKCRYHLNKLESQGKLIKHQWEDNVLCWFPSGWDYK